MKKEETTIFFQKYDNQEITIEHFSKRLKYILIDLRQHIKSEKEIENVKELLIALETHKDRYLTAERRKRRGIPLTDDDKVAEHGLRSIIEEIRDTLKISIDTFDETKIKKELKIISVDVSVDIADILRITFSIS